MKIAEVTEKKVLFGNGKTLTFQHWTDEGRVCCDNGYADFLVLKSLKHLGKSQDKTCYDVKIKWVKFIRGAGIALVYEDGDFSDEIFIPCYNGRTPDCTGTLKVLLVYQNGVREAVWDFSGRV